MQIDAALIIRIVIAIIAAVLFGNGSVVAFNRMNRDWFLDYDDSAGSGGSNGNGGILGSDSGKDIPKVLPKKLLEAEEAGIVRATAVEEDESAAVEEIVVAERDSGYLGIVERSPVSVGAHYPHDGVGLAVEHPQVAVGIVLQTGTGDIIIVLVNVGQDAAQGTVVTIVELHTLAVAILA